MHGTDGITYCKAYQGPRRPGKTGCAYATKVCPNGVHKCFGCGKGGHGKADCRTFDPPPDPVPSKKRRLSTFGKGVGEGGQRATASTDTSVAMPVPFSAFGKGVGGGGQKATASTSTSVAMPVDSPIDLMIWRPSDLNVHGFACLFQFACSMMHRSCAQRMPLYIDLNQSNSLYDSFTEPNSQANWWDDVFLQPYVRSLQNEPEKVKCIIDYMHSWRADSPNTGFRLRSKQVSQVSLCTFWAHITLSTIRIYIYIYLLSVKRCKKESFG